MSVISGVKTGLVEQHKQNTLVESYQNHWKGCGPMSILFFRNVGSVMASIVAVMSTIVLVQSGHDVVYGRSVFTHRIQRIPSSA